MVEKSDNKIPEDGEKSNSHDYFIRYKLLYFTIFSGLGILFPYLPVFYESLFLTKSQIGILCMIPNFCSFMIAPIFSIIGDMLHAHYELMMVSLIVSTLSVLAMIPIKQYSVLSVVVLIGAMTRAPLTPQIDSLVISTLSNKTRYGEMRLWGAISYGIFSFVGGVVTADRVDGVANSSSFRYVFFIHAFWFFLGGFLLLYLVNTVQLHQIMNTIREQEIMLVKNEPIETESQKRRKNKVKDDEEQVGVVTALRRVFAEHPEVSIFSLVVFLSGFGSGVIESFLFIRMGQLGGSGLVMGISRFITCAAEVPMFQVAGSLQERFGVWPMMAVTQLAFVIRFTYYSLLTDPWYVLPCEMLHGLTFATMWSVSCSYANMISPPECHSSMQALLEGLHWGFGSGMGALIGGFAYDQFGAVRLFQASGVLSFCSLLLSVYVSYSEYNRGATEAPRPSHTSYEHVKELELSTHPLTRIENEI